MAKKKKAASKKKDDKEDKTVYLVLKMCTRIVGCDGFAPIFKNLPNAVTESEDGKYKIIAVKEC
jgi:hypothetical protein